MFLAAYRHEAWSKDWLHKLRRVHGELDLDIHLNMASDRYKVWSKHALTIQSSALAVMQDDG